MKTIELNLMLSYPVHWSKWQVLRDIIQNFYDEAGYKRFGKIFHFEYQDIDAPKGKLILSMKSAGFNYEWLIHIGATTKQESRERYAGFYGEGFKVAAMCALRDFSWEIEVRSRDWRLLVVKLETNIDGKPLQQMGYRVEDALDHSDRTIITIGNFDKEDLPNVESAMQNFYYPENPLLGELVWSDEKGAVYKRSNLSKPKQLPESFGCGGDGIVFLAYQVRGSFIMPFVLCNHYFKTEDRDRKTIGRGTVQDVLIDLSYSMPPQVATVLLESLSKYWYNYPCNRDDFESWYATVRKLILRLFWDKDAVKRFLLQNPNLVVCKKPTNRAMEGQRTQALLWQKANRPDLILAQESFSLLGYPTIIDLCEQAGGFNVTREPDSHEAVALQVLQNAAREVLRDFVLEFPSCMIIDNESSSFIGTAVTVPIKEKRMNSMGHKIRYSIHRIELKKKLLKSGVFMDAFATYCHELCHCFGGDSSRAFSLALTEVVALVIKNQKVLTEYQHRWEKHFQQKYELK